MSFARSFDEARGICDYVQLEKTDGKDSASSSPILMGTSEPGTSMAPPVSELVPRRTKIHTRTDSLQRSYASTAASGSGGAKSSKSRKSRVDL